MCNIAMRTIPRRDVFLRKDNQSNIKIGYENGRSDY
jgi:hypothetical protein